LCHVRLGLLFHGHQVAGLKRANEVPYLLLRKLGIVSLLRECLALLRRSLANRVVGNDHLGARRLDHVGTYNAALGEGGPHVDLQLDRDADFLDSPGLEDLVPLLVE